MTILCNISLLGIVMNMGGGSTRLTSFPGTPFRCYLTLGYLSLIFAWELVLSLDFECWVLLAAAVCSSSTISVPAKRKSSFCF